MIIIIRLQTDDGFRMIIMNKYSSVWKRIVHFLYTGKLVNNMNENFFLEAHRILKMAIELVNPNLFESKYINFKI